MKFTAVKKSLLLIMPILLASCGYKSTSSIRTKYTKIAIPIFKNETRHLNKEFKITDAIQKAIISKTNLKLVEPSEAEIVLTGSIMEFNYPVLAEIGLSQPAIYEVSVKVKVDLFNNVTKKRLFTKTIKVSSRFVPSRGEDRTYAENSASAKLSLKILSLLESFLYN